MSTPSCREVVVLRHPARAVRLADALRSAGMTVHALPLTDTELPRDTRTVTEVLDAVARGEYGWLIATSGNAVRALDLVAGGMGTTLATAVRSGRGRVAAVGRATARALEESGVDVDLVPARASSAGLLEEFGPGPGTVLLPQADLAPGDLQEGLEERGWLVRRIEAYRTVPFPAVAVRAVPFVAEDGVQPPVVRPSDVLRLASGDVQPAVVFMAPSAVRHFRDTLTSGTCRFLPVAIGQTTADALRSEGWEPAAVAVDPDVQGIVTAVHQAFGAVFHPSSPPPPSGVRS